MLRKLMYKINSNYQELQK